MAMDWRVTDTRTTTVMTPGGSFQSVKVVYYTTTWGDAGEVEVPADRFTAEAAAELIEAEVAELRKLRDL
jgi:hypothetical protein